MGLAAAKNKRKLGTDPNNTAWSRNISTFGHKILQSQGWQPGQYLGAAYAPHAMHPTAASSSSGIRAVPKDDTLGLGARRANLGDETCTGLDEFQSILARINGKVDEALATEPHARDTVRLGLYDDGKFGAVRFHSAGFLVHEEAKSDPSSDGRSGLISCADRGDGDKPSTSDKKNEKRQKLKNSLVAAEFKARTADKGEDGKVKEERRKERDKKRRRFREDTVTDHDGPKNRKRRKKLQSSKNMDPIVCTTSEFSSTHLPTNNSSSGIKKSMKENKRRKTGSSSDDRPVSSRGNQQEAKDKEQQDDRHWPSSDGKKKPSKKFHGKNEAAFIVDAKPSTNCNGSYAPITSKAPTATKSIRFLARARFIEQKRMAIADPEALQQIFMVRS